MSARRGRRGSRAASEGCGRPRGTCRRNADAFRGETREQGEQTVRGVPANAAIERGPPASHPPPTTTAPSPGGRTATGRRGSRATPEGGYEGGVGPEPLDCGACGGTREQSPFARSRTFQDAAIERFWADAAGKATRPRTTTALLALALLVNRGAPVARSRVHDAAIQLGLRATNRYAHLYTAAAEQLTAEDGALPSQRALDAVSTLEENDRACACPFAENLEQLGQAMLSRLPPSANTWVIDRLAERLRAAVGFSKLGPLHSLLVRGAPWCHPEPTPTQRQILRIIVEHGDWGRFVNVNQAEILRAMGLPADRERLSALAG